MNNTLFWILIATVLTVLAVSENSFKEEWRDSGWKPSFQNLLDEMDDEDEEPIDAEERLDDEEYMKYEEYVEEDQFQPTNEMYTVSFDREEWAMFQIREQFQYRFVPVYSEHYLGYTYKDEVVSVPLLLIQDDGLRRVNIEDNTEKQAKIEKERLLEFDMLIDSLKKLVRPMLLVNPDVKSKQCVDDMFKMYPYLVSDFTIDILPIVCGLVSADIHIDRMLMTLFTILIILSMDSIIIERFKQLSLIPRPSKQLDGVRAFIKEWTTRHNLEFRQDTYGNVVVIAGNVNTSKVPIIIQSHMDMVATKSEDSTHNFQTDPIEVIIDEDRKIMKANQTTLGADNGIGLVSSMVLVEELLGTTFLETHVVYLLMTADEEIGCIGAENIDPYPFLPKKAFMLNVDSEVDGEVCAGSCGGSDCHITLQRVKTVMHVNNLYKLSFSSFSGGHSGLNINDGRASAIKTLIHFIHKLRMLKMTIVYDLVGGNAHNAIPDSAEATFTTVLDEDTLRAQLEEYINDIRVRYNEPGIQTKLVKIKSDNEVSKYSCTKLIDMLMILHQGIIDNNPHNKTCVETSTNIGVVSSTDNIIDVNILTRSSSATAMNEYHNVLECVGRIFEAEVTPFKMYPGWNPDWNNNHVLDVLKKVYVELFGKNCHITKVHAGLETSILLEKYPDWTCMSIGPQIIGAHTYGEYCVLSTIQPFYDWLKATVIRLGE